MGDFESIEKGFIISCECFLTTEGDVCGSVGDGAEEEEVDGFNIVADFDFTSCFIGIIGSETEFSEAVGFTVKVL